MKMTVEIAGDTYHFEDRFHDLSIALKFNGAQPNTYGVPAATSQAFEGGGFVGDTRRGGSCNFETYTFTPHCNGTHTECIGHIAKERISVRETLQESLIPAILATVTPRSQSSDSYLPGLNPKDKVIDLDLLKTELEPVEDEFLGALLLRTLPNDDSKKSRDYMQVPPAFFTLDAMQYIRDRGVRHLLVDLPSVDRLYDEGRLSAHHVYWEVNQGSNEVPPHPQLHSAATITEMIYAPDRIPDGKYLLNLQIAPFHSDAAPSRPVIYPLQKSWIADFD